MSKRRSRDTTGPDKIVDAMPTKALFIEMITRDIDYIPAIVDLVDNCVDGARQLRKQQRFGGLKVEVDLSSKRLRIEDNCGGISVDTARKYAFRFGRPHDAPSIKHSIGRFGVGMKRAFFKLGTRFRVESTSARDRFVLDVDVEKWADSERDWTFEFDEVGEGLPTIPKDQRGTIIEVTGLRGDVVSEFGLPNFENALESEIRYRLQEALDSGLEIQLNGIRIEARPLVFLDDSRIAPASKTMAYRKKSDGKPVTVQLTVGLGLPKDREMAGWHVFCNRRLVLMGDKSPATGWGETHGTKTPFFHPQYNAFRGYAYFDSDDAGRLPWNTSKTGLDAGASVYRAARLQMISMMRPVIDFLNRLKEEKAEQEEAGEDIGPLERIVVQAKARPAAEVETRSVFTMPRVKRRKPKPEGPKMQRIQYDRPKEQVERVKESLGVTTVSEAGRRTFDYYYDAECGE